MGKLIKFLGVILFFAMQYHVDAQQKNDSIIDPKMNIEEYLPPLDSLYIIGLRNNPLQRLEQAQANSYYWNMHYVKRIWTQGIGVFYNYSFGNLPFFSGPLTNQGQNVTLLEGYRVGVDIRLNLFDYLGYKGRVGQAREAWEVAKHKKDVEAFNYKKDVADYYTNLVGAQRIFTARNEDLFVQQVACSVAEKEYKEGVIKISEYARQKNVLAIAVAAQEDARRLYTNYYERLQVILGVKLNTLKR
ncbi:MAG: TolC family protein [Candidatus Methylacidiphilales bacterium]